MPTGFAELIDRDVILARIIPCVQTLSTDQSQHVRAALSKQISGLAPLLGMPATEEYLLPIFLRLLKDEFSEVRLHLISELEVVNKGELVIALERGCTCLH
jgi:serine/threonine-protein phosphatase 2A regulatory subunit A